MAFRVQWGRWVQARWSGQLWEIYGGDWTGQQTSVESIQEGFLEE